MLLSQTIRELELCSSVMLMVDIISICSNSADRSVCYKLHSLLSIAYQPQEYVSCRSTIHLELLLLLFFTSTTVPIAVRQGSKAEFFLRPDLILTLISVALLCSVKVLPPAACWDAIQPANCVKVSHVHDYTTAQTDYYYYSYERL